MQKFVIYLLLILFISPLFIFGLPTLMLIGPGFIPALVAFVTDKEKEKTSTISVFYGNACGVLPQVIALWHDNHTMDGALKLLINPYTWLYMYAGAAVGWGIYILFPVVISKTLFLYGYYKIKLCKERQKELLQEWGDKIRR